MAHEPRWLRWTHKDPNTPPRDLTEDQFIWEVLQLAEQAFASLPPEPMLVEGLDAPGAGVQWRAYVDGPRELLGVARQLAVERCLRRESTWGGSEASVAEKQRP
ncbi:MAG: hypothetical protein QM778_30290 [Myxococcales bacterium]